MPGRAKVASTRNLGRPEKPETTAIVLRIAADHAKDFEAMFEAEEIPIWDDFARRGRFLAARLVRTNSGREPRGGTHAYLLPLLAAHHQAHQEHDRPPRFRALLPYTAKPHPQPPLVLCAPTI